MRGKLGVGLAVLVCMVLPSPAALAWDAAGHRAVTRLALVEMQRRMGAQAPMWLANPDAIEQIAYAAAEPDRWRSTKSVDLKHLNEPDHYMDLERLAPMGLTIESLPRLRYEFVRLAAIRVNADPSIVPVKEGPRFDPAKLNDWPGFLPYAIMERYGQVRATMQIAAVWEKRAKDKPAGSPEALQLAMARAGVYYQMGQLSHFVGDAAQPLHTTEHHHGWVGQNPKGYTTDKKFHSYIDGRVLTLHKLDAPVLLPGLVDIHGPELSVDPQDPWPQVIAYIARSHAKVEPLYELEKSGELKNNPGKEFISERLIDAGRMLGALYAAAGTLSLPVSEEQVGEYIRYDGPAAAEPTAAEPKTAAPAGVP